MENLIIIVLATILTITILTGFVCLYKLARKNRPRNTKK
jgi:hypothetical protein